jgi:hypothetical protein
MRSIVAWDSVLLLFLLLMHYPLHITSEISICRQTVCTCPSLILSTALPALQHPEITPKKDRDESRTRSCPSHCPDSTWNRPNHPPEDLCTLLLIAHVQLLSGYPSPQPARHPIHVCPCPFTDTQCLQVEPDPVCSLLLCPCVPYSLRPLIFFRTPSHGQGEGQR